MLSLSSYVDVSSLATPTLGFRNICDVGQSRPLMFAYTRVSTEGQADHRNGLEAQRKAFDMEAIRRGWDVKHYADEGREAVSA